MIVHSEFCRRYLEELGCRTPIFVVPHPIVESEAAMRAGRGGASSCAAGAARGPRARTCVVAPGDLNEAKQLDAVLAAVARLPDGVHLALVGRRIEGYDVEPGRSRRRARGPGHARPGRRATTISAGGSARPTWSWTCGFPHRGEVSGSLARAMQAGRPTIVSATGTYLDVPDELVMRVAPGPTDPAELAAPSAALADDPDLRARMGAAARDHMRRLRETEATAHGYAERDREPRSRWSGTRRARPMARWAGALADLGSATTSSPGYGTRLRAPGSYAERRCEALLTANAIGAPLSPARTRC